MGKRICILLQGFHIEIACNINSTVADKNPNPGRAFSNLLKTLEPGQTVTATVKRGEEAIAVEVTVEAR